MAPLIVSSPTDYRQTILANIDRIEFANDSASAIFSADQFGPGFISPSVVFPSSFTELTVHVEQNEAFSAAGWDVSALSSHSPRQYPAHIVLIGNAGDETITGSSAADTIIGGPGFDQLFGGDGNDTFILNAGDEPPPMISDSRSSTISGGNGFDRLVVTEDVSSYSGPRNIPSTGAITFNSVEAIYFDSADGATLSLERISGLPSDLLLVGDAFSNVIEINMPASSRVFPSNLDLSNWQFSNWTAGADRVAINWVGNQIKGTQKDDIIQVSGIYNPGDGTTVDGGSGNDQIGTIFAARLIGGAGDDRLSGSDFSDALYGGTENDELNGQSGNDYLYGEVGADVLYGEDGGDALFGGAGQDILIGGSDKDYLYGEAGVDALYGESGDDVLIGGADTDYLYGQDGLDFLYGEEGQDALYGGAERDVLYGQDGGDYLYGEAGNDHIEGGAGADSITGGTGNDTLYGEAGGDYFYFLGAFGQDAIGDFSHIGGDRIVFSAAEVNPQGGVGLEYYASSNMSVFSVAELGQVYVSGQLNFSDIVLV